MSIHSRTLGVGLALAIGLASAPASAKPAVQPDAVAVILRGKRRLADALHAALAPALADPTRPRPVAVIVDSTDNLRRWEGYMQRALEEVGTKLPAVTSWSICALGGVPSKPVESPTALPVTETIAARPKVKNTIMALTKSVSLIRGRDPVVA